MCLCAFFPDDFLLNCHLIIPPPHTHTPPSPPCRRFLQWQSASPHRLCKVFQMTCKHRAIVQRTIAPRLKTYWTPGFDLLVATHGMGLLVWMVQTGRLHHESGSTKGQLQDLLWFCICKAGATEPRSTEHFAANANEAQTGSSRFTAHETQRCMTHFRSQGCRIL